MPYVTPAPTRPWYNQVNVPARSYASVKGMTDSFLWMFKEALKGTLTGGATGGTRAPASLWTVVGSSDGVTFSPSDGVDRWGATYTPSLLVNAASGTAHSWMILRNTALGVFLTIDYNSATAGRVYLQWSLTSPGNGTLTLGPRHTVTANETPFGQSGITTTDNLLLCSDSIFGSGRFHFAVDQFGGFYAALSRNGAGICSTAVGLVRYGDTRPEDVAPVIGLAASQATGRGAFSGIGALMTTNVCGARQFAGTTRCAQGGPQVPYFGNSVLPVALTIDVGEGKFAALDIPVFHNDVGQMAYRGLLPDMWYCSNNQVGDGQANATTIVGDVHLPFFLVPPNRPTF
jgi:hypothetical protein